MISYLSEIYNSVVEGDRTVTEISVRAALESGLDAESILNQGLVAAMSEVGKRYEQGDYYVPEMLISARAMQAGLGILKSELIRENVDSAGKILICSVKGDLHDVGKNLVGMMFEGAGFEVIDLGTDVSTENLVVAINECKPQIVGMSALLTTTMRYMQRMVETLAGLGLRDQVKIIIGGAPVTQAFCHQIGADGYAPDASRAVGLAKELLQV